MIQVSSYGDRHACASQQYQCKWHVARWRVVLCRLLTLNCYSQLLQWSGEADSRSAFAAAPPAGRLEQPPSAHMTGPPDKLT